MNLFINYNLITQIYSKERLRNFSRKFAASYRNYQLVIELRYEGSDGWSEV